MVLIGTFGYALLLDAGPGEGLPAIWVSLLLVASTAIVVTAAHALHARREARSRRQALERLAARLANVTPVDIHRPISVEGLPDDLAEMAAQMNQALERLAAGYATLRTFTSDAAHQLRTPLAVLSARLASGTDLVEVEHVRHDLDWMTRLVGQLLSVARLSDTEPEPDDRFDLVALGSDVVAALFPLAVFRERDLELTIDGDEPVWVRGSSALAFEALGNLVENALAHTPVRSTVSVVLDKVGGIEVWDQGSGVPPDHRERIFNRFEQGPTPTQGGAGLGLSIVADVMRKHHGQVSYRDRPGGGAVFRLQFRLANPDAPVAL